MQLKGENLRVVDVPEAQIDASPDLDFKVDGRRIEVGGAVKVPFGEDRAEGSHECRARLIR